MGGATEATSVFRSMGKTSVSGAGNCGRQQPFDDCDVHALVRYVDKNKG